MEVTGLSIGALWGYQVNSTSLLRIQVEITGLCMGHVISDFDTAFTGPVLGIEKSG